MQWQQHGASPSNTPMTSSFSADRACVKQADKVGICAQLYTQHPIDQFKLATEAHKSL